MRLVEGFFERERALVVSRLAAPPPTPSANSYTLHERVLSGPWGRDVGPAERAWLWYEAGALERAAEILYGSDPPNGILADQLRARLD